MIILKLKLIYNLSTASFIFDYISHGKDLTLKSSICMSYPCHSYHTWSSSDMLLTYVRVGAFRMNFRYQFINVWFKISEFIQYQRLYKTFTFFFTELYLSRPWFLHQPYDSVQGFLMFLFFALVY